MGDADRIILTDMCDNLVCNFEDSFIVAIAIATRLIPDQKLLEEVLPYLIPIQLEEKMACDIVMATKHEMNEYSNEIERQTGMTMY